MTTLRFCLPFLIAWYIILTIYNCYYAISGQGIWPIAFTGPDLLCVGTLLYVLNREYAVKDLNLRVNEFCKIYISGNGLPRRFLGHGWIQKVIIDGSMEPTPCFQGRQGAVHVTIERMEK